MRWTMRYLPDRKVVFVEKSHLPEYVCFDHKCRPDEIVCPEYSDSVRIGTFDRFSRHNPNWAKTYVSNLFQVGRSIEASGRQIAILD